MSLPDKEALIAIDANAILARCRSRFCKVN